MAKPIFEYRASASDRDLITSTVKYGGTRKRYFSSLDAELYIDGKRIVDIVRIDYSYEEKKFPLYGFNSFMPSRILVGQKMIQGTFVINFTKPAYIANLIANAEGSVLNKDTDIVGKSCSSNNAPLFKKGVDILIGYGGYNVEGEISYNTSCQTIEGVYINGYQQMLDTSGEPIMEVYSFIAKNLTFGIPTDKTEANAVNQGSNESSSNSKIKDLILAVKSNNSDVDKLKKACADDLAQPGIVADCYINTKTKGVEFNVKDLLNIKDVNFELKKVKVSFSDIALDHSEIYELKVKDKFATATIDNDYYTMMTDKIKKANSNNVTVNVAVEYKINNSDGNLSYNTKINFV